MSQALSKLQALNQCRDSRDPRDEDRSPLQSRVASLKMSHLARHALGFALLLAILVAMKGDAQNSPFNRPLGSSASCAGGDQECQFGDRDPMVDQRRMRAINAMRHKSLVSDTEKLLKLANELDGELKAHGTDSITPSEFNKAGEIEKLAHKVKENMSTSLQTPTDFDHPLFSPMH